MMFAADVFERLFAHEMWKPVKQFKAKLSLFARQAGEGKFCHFPSFGKQKVSENVSGKIKYHLQSLEDKITREFQDFKIIERKFNLLSYPITVDIVTAPELIDMQSDQTGKEMFKVVT